MPERESENGLTNFMTIVNKIIDVLSSATGPFKGFTKSLLTLGGVIALLSTARVGLAAGISGAFNWFSGKTTIAQMFGNTKDVIAQGTLSGTSYVKAAATAVNKEGKTLKQAVQNQWNQKGIDALRNRENYKTWKTEDGKSTTVADQIRAIQEGKLDVNKANLDSIRGGITQSLFSDSNFIKGITNTNSNSIAVKDGNALVDGYMSALSKQIKARSSDKGAQQEANVAMNQARYKIQQAAYKGAIESGKNHQEAYKASQQALLNMQTNTAMIPTTKVDAFAQSVGNANSGLMQLGMLLQGTPLAPFGKALTMVSMAASAFTGIVGGLVGELATLAVGGAAAAASLDVTAAGFAADTAWSELDAAAKWKVIYANHALLGSMVHLLVIFAAIAAAVAVVWGLYQALTYNARQLQTLHDRAAAASDAFKSVKQEVAELKDNLNSLEEYDEAFKTLVAGTAEFNSKLVESNELITSLIKKYPMLETEGYVTTDKNGRMQISQAGRDAVQQLAAERQAKAQAIDIFANADYKKEQARQEVYKTKEYEEAYQSENRGVAGRYRSLYKKRNLEEMEAQGADTTADVVSKAEEKALAQVKQAQSAAVTAMISSQKDLIDRNAVSRVMSEGYDQLLETIEADAEGKDRAKTYAEAYGYEYISGNKFKDQSGNEIEVKKDIWNDEITNKRLKANDQIISSAETVDRTLDSLNGKVADAFDDIKIESDSLISDILSSNIETNQDELKALLDKGDFSELVNDLTQEQKDALAEAGIDDLGAALEERGQKILDAQQQQDENLAIMMAKARGFNADDFVNNNAKYAGQISALKIELDSLNTKEKTLLNTVGQGLTDSLGEQSMGKFMDTFLTGSQTVRNELSEITKDVDWSSSISALDAITKMSKSAVPAVKSLGEEMRASAEGSHLLSDSMQEMFAAEDFIKATENMDNFVNSSGRVDASGIKKMAQESGTLNKLLETGAISAGGLAAALNATVVSGELDITSLNDSVLQLLSSFTQLDTAMSEAHDIVSNFDPGIDTGEGEDFIKDAYEKAHEYIKNGEWGNEQLENYMRLIVGDKTWANALAKNNGDLEKTVKHLEPVLNNFKNGFLESWRDLGNGIDAYGNKIGKIDFNNEHQNKLKVTRQNGKIDFNVKEAQATTEETLEWIEKSYKVSSDMAVEMLAYFKNYSHNLTQELEANDFNAGITSGDFYKTNTVKTAEGTEVVTLSSSTIKAIAAGSGKTVEEIRGLVKDKLPDGKELAFLTNTYQKGERKGELIDNYKLLNKRLSNLNEGKDENAKREKGTSLAWLDRFTKDNQVNVEKALSYGNRMGLDKTQTQGMLYEAFKKLTKEGKEFKYNGEVIDPSDINSLGDFIDRLTKIDENENWNEVGKAIAAGYVAYIKGKEGGGDNGDNGNGNGGNGSNGNNRKGTGGKGTGTGNGVNVGGSNGGTTRTRPSRNGGTTYTGTDKGKEPEDKPKKPKNPKVIEKATLDSWSAFGLPLPEKKKTLKLPPGVLNAEARDRSTKTTTPPYPYDEETANYYSRNTRKFSKTIEPFTKGINDIITGMNNPVFSLLQGKPIDALANTLMPGVTRPVMGGFAKMFGLGPESVYADTSSLYKYSIPVNGKSAYMTANGFVDWNLKKKPPEKTQDTSSKSYKQTNDDSVKLDNSIKKLGKTTKGTTTQVNDTTNKYKGLNKAQKDANDSLKNAANTTKTSSKTITKGLADAGKDGAQKLQNALNKTVKGGPKTEKTKAKTSIQTEVEDQAVTKLQKKLKRADVKIKVKTEDKELQNTGKSVKALQKTGKKGITVKTNIKNNSIQKAENAIRNVGNAAKNVKDADVKVKTTADLGGVNKIQKAARVTQKMPVTSVEGPGARNAINTLHSLASKSETFSVNVAAGNKKNFTVTVKAAAKGMNNHYTTEHFPLASLGSLAAGTQKGRIGPKGKGGLTLTGEKGYEVAWLPHQGKSMILGAQGPEMLNLPSDAVVWNHEQSKKIVKRKQFSGGTAAIGAGSAADIPDGSGSSYTVTNRSHHNNTGGGKKPKKPKEELRWSEKSLTYIVKVDKLLKKAGKISTWWENITKQIAAAERLASKNQKAFEKVMSSVGSTWEDVSKSAEEYTKSLNLQIKYNEEVFKKYQNQLENIDNGNGLSTKIRDKYIKNANATSVKKKGKKKRTGGALGELNRLQVQLAAAEKTSSKKDDKAIKNQIKRLKRSKKYKNALDKINKNSSLQTISWNQDMKVKYKTNKSKGKWKTKKAKVKQTRAIDFSKLIYQDPDTGEYLLDQSKINKTGKSKAERKAIKAKAQKLVDEKNKRRNEAQDKIEAAREELAKLANDTYDMFKRWEKSITEVYLISKKLETLNNEKDVYSAQQDYLETKMMAGYGGDTFIDDLKEVLTNQRKNITDRIEANKAMLEAAEAEYKAAINWETYQNEYDKKQSKKGDVHAEKATNDYNAAKYAFQILRDTGFFSTGEFNIDSINKAFTNYEEKGFTNTTGTAVKEVIDRIQELHGDYLSAVQDTYGSVTEIYALLNEYQDYINEFEESLLKGLEEQLNKEIEQQQKLNSALTDAFKDLLDEVKRRLDQRRQQEDNAKTESDISKKQQRLAALQADTSGGHAGEIKQLQQEIAEAQQQYGRTLEDQLLQRLQDQGDKAAEQRERQIKLLEIQRDLAQATGTNLEEVKEWLKNPTKNKEQIKAAWLANKDYDESLPGEREKLEKQFEIDYGKYLVYLDEVKDIKDVLDDVNGLDEEYKTTVAKTLATIESLLRDDIVASLKANTIQNMIAEGKSGVEVQQATGAGAQYLQKEFNKSGETSSSNNAMAGVEVKKGIEGTRTWTDKKGKRHKEKVNTGSGHLNASGTKVAAAKGDKVYFQNWDSATGTATGEISRADINNDKLNLDTVKNNKEEFKEAINYAITHQEPGTKINVNMKKIISTLGIANKGYKLQNGANAHLGAAGTLWWGTKKGMNYWDTTKKAKPGFIAYNKKKFKEVANKLKKEKKTNTAKYIEYARSLRANGIKGYKTGGLATTTGPAWLDGTRAKPEAVLSATDTKNFIALKDILSDVMGHITDNNTTTYGDSTYEININVDHLNNDYDVDKVAKRVEKIITEDASYRNVTMVRKFR